MNEELQKVLTDMLSKASTGIDATKTFLESEIPEVMTQLLLWYGVVNFAWMVWSISCFSVSIFFIFKIIGIFNTEGVKFTSGANDQNPSKECTWVVMMGFSSFIFSIVGFTTMNLIWLQIWIAPKIFLIAYAASLAK